MLFINSPYEGTHMYVLNWEEGKWKDILVYHGQPKNHLRRTVLSLDLSALNFKGILTIDVFLDSM